MRGTISGDAKLFWAVREGGSGMIEEEVKPGPGGSVNCFAKVRCEGRGDVYILVRLDGENATLTGVSVEWSPFSDNLLGCGITCEKEDIK